MATALCSEVHLNMRLHSYHGDYDGHHEDCGGQLQHHGMLMFTKQTLSTTLIQHTPILQCDNNYQFHSTVKQSQNPRGLDKLMNNRIMVVTSSLVMVISKDTKLVPTTSITNGDVSFLRAKQ